MGKRCIDSGCGYVAADGSCLMPKEDLKEKCPCRESVHRTDRDYWMDLMPFGKTMKNVRKRSLRD